MHPNDAIPTKMPFILKMATESINNSPTKFGFVPSQINDMKYDPWLRQVLYPDRKIQPFNSFYSEQLKLQKKLSKPDPKALENMDESPNNWRLADEVMIDFPPSTMGRKTYKRQRGQIYRISRIDTRTKPYLYVLETLKGKEVMLCCTKYS